MKIASLVKSIILSANERPLPARGELRVGDRLVGRVLELKGGGRAFLDFGRFRAMADVGFPLKQGEVIHVKVMDNGAPLRLGLCSHESGNLEKAPKTLVRGGFPARHLINELHAQIRDLLPVPNAEHKGKSGFSEISNAVRNLISHFEPIDMRKDVSRISGQLKRLIEDAGIFYEKKLEKMMEPFVQGRNEVSARELSEILEMKDVVHKDLKANLLVLRGFIEAKDPALKMLGMKDPEGILKTVDKFLGEMNARQEDAGTKSMRSESGHVFTYLLPMKELEEDAKVRVYYSKKKRGAQKREGFRVSLLLSMEKLGQIRTDFFLKGQGLSVDFSVSERPIKEYMDDHLDVLKNALDDLFEDVSVRVDLSEKAVSEFDFEDLTPVSAGLIDFKV